MTNLLGREIPRIGMGCWAIGGPMYRNGNPLGYGNANATEATRALSAAYECGVRLFDTAAAYGTGHSEILIGNTLAKRDDVLISTKVGLGIDPETKELTGESFDITAQIEDSLKRLKRETVDLIFLHLNACPIETARPLFDELETCRERGLIGAYGWSTDFPDRASAFADRQGFSAIQHAMNVFFDASELNKTLNEKELISFIRSPLAMGVLTGKFSSNNVTLGDDVRGNTVDRQVYFENGQPKAEFTKKIEAIRELLTMGGRTAGQGALCWLLAKSETSFPLPGARSAAQVEENFAALEKGPLSADVMSEIETLIDRQPETAPQEL